MNLATRRLTFLVALAICVVTLVVLSVNQRTLAYPGTEAPDSTIPLQMPFIAGETWTVGGAGYFYGVGDHTNALDSYYATDWNRANDDGAPLLAVADGIVSAVATPDAQSQCPNTSVGCYVQVNHSNGYRTEYDHLSAVSVTVGSSIKTSTLIGKVGNTGYGSHGAHLHLVFRHLDNGGYHSRCYNSGISCPNNETPQAPQGYKPSPMMTTLGPTTLADAASYTSVNGRVYLPDLPTTGWDTNIYVRNDGTEQRQVGIYFYNPDGTSATSIACTLISNAHCGLPVSSFVPTGFNGSAYIDGGEAVSAVAFQERLNSGTYHLAAYNGLLVSGSSGWDQIATRLFAPLVKDSHFGRSSRIRMFNAGSGTTTANVLFYPSGSASAPNIPSKGKAEVLSTNCSVTLCSAEISSSNSQWLAGVIVEHADGSLIDLPSMYNASDSGVTKNFVPVVKKSFGGLTTGIVVQNLGSAATTVSLTCYATDGNTSTYNCGTQTIASKASAVFYLGNIITPPVGFLGSGVLTATQPIIASFQESASLTQTLATNAVLTATKTAYAPIIYGSYSQGGQWWDSGLQIQNAITATASVTVTYYNTQGTAMATKTNTVEPNRTWILTRWRGTVPSNFFGSAVIQSSQPVAVTVNTTHTGSGDTGASYNAPSR